MLAANICTHPTACRSCGAYSVSRCPLTCRPGRAIKLRPSRRARRDARTSALVRTNARIQDDLIRGL